MPTRLTSLAGPLVRSLGGHGGNAAVTSHMAEFMGLEQTQRAPSVKERQWEGSSQPLCDVKCVDRNVHLVHLLGRTDIR